MLEFFLFDPLNEYYEREVAGKTNVSRGSAHKILVKLANVDFLTRKERGRMLMYRLNLKEPTVKQLKIAINTFAVEEAGGPAKKLFQKSCPFRQLLSRYRHKR